MTMPKLSTSAAAVGGEPSPTTGRHGRSAPCTGDVLSSFDDSDEHWFSKLRTAGVLFLQAQLFVLPRQIAMTLLDGAKAALAVLAGGADNEQQAAPAGATR